MCYLQWQNHVLKSHQRHLPHGASISSCSTFHHGEQGTNISLQHRETHTGLTCKNLPLHDWGYICPRTAAAPCFLSLVKWILQRTQLVCSQSSQPDIYERSFSQFVICNERSLIQCNLHIPWELYPLTCLSIVGHSKLSWWVTIIFSALKWNSFPSPTNWNAESSKFWHNLMGDSEFLPICAPQWEGHLKDTVGIP
jgi:hypothetical protein